MRKKRFLALALSVCMLATAGPAWATDTATEDEQAVTSETSADEAAPMEISETDDDAAADELADEAAPLAIEPRDIGGEEAADEEQKSLLTVETFSYYEALQEYEQNGYRSVSEDTQIVLNVEDAKSNKELQLISQKDDKGNDQKGIDFSKDAECEYVEWTFQVEKAGLYEIHAQVYNVASYGMTIQRQVLLDGEVPFDEANNIYFYRRFEEEGKPEKNAIGNEVWPKNKEICIWQDQPVMDYNGYFADPLKFYLSEGEHTLRFEYIDQAIYLGDVTLKGEKTYPTYNDIRQEYKKAGYEAAKTEPIVFEAEDTLYKNDSTIRRGTDNDSMTSPSSAVDRLLNIIGEKRWSTGNQSITWEFDVPADGLYTINMRGMQNFSTGMPSTREIRIDDEIPFEELRMYQFEYKEGWSAYCLHDDMDAPFEFYLTEGRHTITMTVKSGRLYDVIRLTNDIITQVSNTYLKITKITSTDPDSNYEYDLARTLPELAGKNGEIAVIAKAVKNCADILADMSNMTTDMENSYREIEATLNQYAEDPDLIPANLSDFENVQTNLGNYITEMGSMPLTFDYFSINPVGEEFTVKKSNFFQKFRNSVLNFIASFTKDYDAVGSIFTEGGETKIIDVWMARGTEWGEVLKDLADEDFTKDTGIAVNLNILPSGQLNAGNVSALMLAITSGTAPDAAIGVAFSDPVEFAFRDAVVDLTQFEDFEEYRKQFYDTLFIPYEYTKDDHTGIYGIPETMDFTCMMYRSDVMDSLGLELPRTWDDLFHTTLPVLFENNMSFSFPVDTTASSNSPSSLKGMTMFLIQQGGSYYTEDGMYSGLDTPQAYNAFKQWTDLYTSYGLDAESSFFTRFRNGTLPIGIGAYASYMQVLTQAPELYGRWGIAPMIGTGTGKVDENGEEIVDNRVGGISLTSCQIMSQSDQQEESWEFLKWWMDQETQVKFGQEIEATMGITARWNSANIQAFESLPWDKEDIKIIKEQMAKAEEQPIILGGYFTTRHLVNAWNRVYMTNQNPRDALEEAVKDINKEIRNKHEEYGFVYED